MFLCIYLCSKNSQLLSLIRLREMLLIIFTNEHHKLNLVTVLKACNDGFVIIGPY
jgi:hypothetical protein